MVKLTQAVRFETSDKKRLTRSKDITGGVENKIKHSKLQFRFTKSWEEEYNKKLHIVKYETSYTTECEHVNTTLRTDTQVSLRMVMEDISEGGEEKREGRGLF